MLERCPQWEEYYDIGSERDPEGDTQKLAAQVDHVVQTRRGDAGSQRLPEEVHSCQKDHIHGGLVQHPIVKLGR